MEHWCFFLNWVNTNANACSTPWSSRARTYDVWLQHLQRQTSLHKPWKWKVFHKCLKLCTYVIVACRYVHCCIPLPVANYTIWQFIKVSILFVNHVSPQWHTAAIAIAWLTSQQCWWHNLRCIIHINQTKNGLLGNIDHSSFYLCFYHHSYKQILEVK